MREQDGDGTTLLKNRVTDVAVSGGGWLPVYEADQDDDAVPVFVYIWPSSHGVPLSELRLYRDQDIEQWFDDTGLIWPPEARRELCEQLPKNERDRPIIAVGGELSTVRDRAIEALVLANAPPVFFRRGGLVTEIALNEKRVPSARQVTVVRMRDRLGEVARWQAKDGRGGDYFTKPPADIASNLLETPGLVLPALDSIVEFPVMGHDGRISIRRGYDPSTATYFWPSIPLRSLHVDGPNGPPTKADTKPALSLIAEMLRDFEFVSHADKTNVLALMLTPVLRPIIDGSVPLAGVRAVKAGTGKSLLVKAAFTLLTGREPAPTGLGGDEDEAEKRLTAALLAGGPFIFLDNVRTGTVLDSASLARALTAQVWEGRIITTSKYPSLPIRCTWVATGNNLTFSDEIARRTYMIELASQRGAARPSSPGELPPTRSAPMGARRPRSIALGAAGSRTGVVRRGHEDHGWADALLLRRLVESDGVRPPVRRAHRLPRERGPQARCSGGGVQPGTADPACPSPRGGWRQPVHPEGASRADQGQRRRGIRGVPVPELQDLLGRP